MLMMPVIGRVEVLTGSGRRRRWSAEDKARVVAESYATSVGEVSDRYGMCKTQLFTWRREANSCPGPTPADQGPWSLGDAYPPLYSDRASMPLGRLGRRRAS